MEAVARAALEFTRWVDDHPQLLDLTTREVLRELREWLDERHPGWREKALAALGDEASGVEVEMLFDERTIRGSILQRPTAN